MKPLSKKERDALAGSLKGEAAFSYCYQVLNAGADAEAVRAAHWGGLTRTARVIAVGCAGLDRSRADKPLSEFDAVERVQVCRKVESMIRELEKVIRCMQGGKFPQTGPMQ